MFYSHQLLARKVPLGQIWMAATMHAKMNRKKLSKLNLIKICEEILNPSVPMALRLSGILMGGVVIVYQRKVKLLYDDATRLLVEINQAWKIKADVDPTVLPKGKRQARKESVTLPDRNESDLEEIERSVNFSNNVTGIGEFQRTTFIAMQLDDIEEHFVGNDRGEGDAFHDNHQAAAENITLVERFDYQGNTDTYYQDERFDIEGDEETQTNFPTGDQTEMPTLVPSPPRQEEPQEGQQSEILQQADEIPQQADEIHDQHPDQQTNQQSNESKETRQDQHMQGPLRRKHRKRPATYAMDYEQTIVPSDLYQSWLQDTSDIVSKGRKRKAGTGLLSSIKIAKLMDLPPVVLMDDLYIKENRTLYYPDPLLQLWTRSTQPPHDSPSARFSPPQPPEPSVSSPQGRPHFQEQPGFPSEDIHSGIHSQPGDFDAKLMPDIPNNNMQIDIENLPEDLKASFVDNARGPSDTNVATPQNSAHDGRSASLSSHSSGMNSRRFNHVWPHSSARQDSTGLRPVAEEKSWANEEDPNFELLGKLAEDVRSVDQAISAEPLMETGPTQSHQEPSLKPRRLSEDVRLADQEPLMETGPTQTQPQKPISTPPVDNVTKSIRQQMKIHFEAPGAPATESLLKIAAGFDRKAAAVLFYQTCVLASRDELRVEQKVPYGDIIISKGVKM